MNIIKSIWNYKCPRCRKGDLFNKPFHISKPLSMPERCDCCQLKYEPEPGYFFGAMFVSYIITGWLFLGIIAFCMLVIGWGINASFAILIAIAAILYFWIARISRSIFIHIDNKYDKSIQCNKQQIK